MNFPAYKNFFIGAALLIVLGISFLFREEISRMLSFYEPEKASSPVAAESPKVGSETRDGDIPDESKEVVSPTPVIAANPAPPPYAGREPTEFRPVHEESKLFNEDQLKRIAASLNTHGRAVKISPTYFNGWINIGMLKKLIGDFEGARDAWEYAGVIEPLNSLSFSNLGELYWRYLPIYPESEKNLRTSIKHKPDDIQNYVTLAELYHYSYEEKYDLADDVLLEGLKNNPGDGTLTRRLAYLYEQRKEWGSALEWWKKVLEGAPDDEAVKQEIAELEQRLAAGGIQ